MEITTTFRHMDSSAALRQYAIDRLNKIRKYFKKEPLSGHVVLAVENDHQHMAELQITLPNGDMMQAREATVDMYSSIDLAGARLERQVRRWKDKRSDYKPHGDGARVELAAEQGGTDGDMDGGKAGGKSARKGSGKGAADSAPPGEGRSAWGGTKPDRSKSVPVAPLPTPFRVIKEKIPAARSMRVEEAVMQLNLVDAPFLLFRDTDNGALALVYRRRDGAYGLVDTGAKLSPRSTDS